MKTHAKIHLFETAHSGFYEDNLSAKVNLVPKTWTKYTVTDGNWMTDKTLIPLCNRDIFLANEIDKVDTDKKNHYRAGTHIIIDHENKEIQAIPFDTFIEFGQGLNFIPDNCSITVNLNPYLGGIENKLYYDGEGLNYSYIPGVNDDTLDTTITSNLPFTAKINDSLDIESEFKNSDLTGSCIVVLYDNILDFDDDVISGNWKHSKVDAYLPDQNIRYTGTTAGYEDYGTTAWEHTDEYTVTGTDLNCFDPTDDKIIITTGDNKQAGKNLIYGNVNMLPENSLFIW